MKHSFLFFLLLLSSFTYAQETVTVRLIDKVNKNPIRSATILAQNKSEETQSNYVGFFQIQAKTGDTLEISHPSYFTSKIVVPNANSFALPLERKYYDLGELIIEDYLKDSIALDLTKPINEVDTTGMAKYKSGWSEFYKDFGNALAERTNIHELIKGIIVYLSFSISDDGAIEEIVLNQSYLESNVKEEIATALMQLNNWSPATLNGVPYSQFFKINIAQSTLFTIVESHAMPKDGIQSFYDYLYNNIKLPKNAEKLDIEEFIKMEMIITEKGELTNVKVIEGSKNIEFNDQLIEIVSNSPKWEPAISNGVITREKRTFPIKLTFN